MLQNLLKCNTGGETLGNIGVVRITHLMSAATKPTSSEAPPSLHASQQLQALFAALQDRKRLRGCHQNTSQLCGYFRKEIYCR